MLREREYKRNLNPLQLNTWDLVLRGLVSKTLSEIGKPPWEGEEERWKNQTIAMWGQLTTLVQRQDKLLVSWLIIIICCMQGIGPYGGLDSLAITCVFHFIGLLPTDLLVWKYCGNALTLQILVLVFFPKKQMVSKCGLID